MLELMAEVELAIVWRLGLPHFPNDLQPALGQATEGAGMTFAAGTVLGVVGLRPGSVQAAQVGKEVQDGAKVFVAGAPEVYAVDLAGLEADGRGAGIELEGLGVGKEAT